MAGFLLAETTISVANLRENLPKAVYAELILTGEFKIACAVLPDELWIKLLKIKNQYIDIAFDHHKPLYIGTWLNDIVYHRLAPGIYESLQGINPCQEDYGISKKHRQYMTKEARRQLNIHFVAISYMIDTSDTEEEFMQKLDVKYPKVDEESQYPFSRLTLKG